LEAKIQKIDMFSAISRRRFLGLTAAALAAGPGFLEAAEIPSVPADLDHILVGINDLNHGIVWMEERSGVRAIIGGVHPGRGTRNALLSLGLRHYIEIIAPDPQQSSASNDLVDRLRVIQEPQLVGWAAHTNDLAGLAQRLVAAGIAIETPRDGSRTRPDGKTLRWKSFSLKEDFGVLPFFIEWSADSVHPSQDAPAGCALQHFFLESPALKEVSLVVRKIDLRVDARLGKRSLLGARITGKNGAFEVV